MVNSVIHSINLYPVDSAIILVYLLLVHWIEIYPMDSAIQLLNNCGLVEDLSGRTGCWEPNKIGGGRGSTGRWERKGKDQKVGETWGNYAKMLNILQTNKSLREEAGTEGKQSHQGFEIALINNFSARKDYKMF